MAITPKELADVIYDSIDHIYRPRNINKQNHAVTKMFHHPDLKFGEHVGAFSIKTKDGQIFSVMVIKMN